MKKRAIVASATIFAAALFTLSNVSVSAETVSNDNFIFNANSAKSSYSSSGTVANKSNIKLSMSSNYTAARLNSNATFADYNFTKAIKATKTSDNIFVKIYKFFTGQTDSNVSNSSFYVNGKKNTTIGVYYAFEDDANATFSFVKETSNSYNTLATYNGSTNNVYYNEFTFDSDTTIGLKSTDNLYLYGLTVVSNDELTNRLNAENSISALIDYVKENGYSNTAKIEELINNANNELLNVNHVSTVSNYNDLLNVVNEYNNYLVEYNKALDVVTLINNLNDVEYTENYKNELDNVNNALSNVNVELVSNYDEFLNKNNAFNELSNAKVNAFNNKVAEANNAKGTKESYVLINECNDLYDELIESDKLNDTVVESLNTLEVVKNAYSDYEESVTQNDVFYSYNEDGSIKKILFIGTVENFVSLDDFKLITFYIENKTTGEMIEENVYTLNKSLKIQGVFVKEKIEGIRYIYSSLLNTDDIYLNNVFTMKYRVEYKSGVVITSSLTTVEVM